MNVAITTLWRLALCTTPIIALSAPASAVVAADKDYNAAMQAVLEQFAHPRDVQLISVHSNAGGTVYCGTADAKADGGQTLFIVAFKDGRWNSLVPLPAKRTEQTAKAAATLQPIIKKLCRGSAVSGF